MTFVIAGFGIWWFLCHVKKILIPTDFSQSSANAIDFAIKLFGNQGVKYLLLNCYVEPVSSKELLVTIKDIFQKDSEKGLKEQLKSLRKKYSDENIDFETWSEYGSCHSVISDVVKKESIDFIVMGTKGASGLQKAFTGSNTATIIKDIKCPVFVIPESLNFHSIKNIVFAADYESSLNGYLDSLNPLKDLAEHFHSKISIINVFEDAKMKENRAAEGFILHQSLNHIPHDFFIIEDKNVVQGIIKFVHKNKSDIISMVLRKKSWLEKIFHKSISKEMSMLTDLPLLILPELSH